MDHSESERLTDEELLEKFKGTHPAFQGRIRKLAAVAPLELPAVYRLWLAYSETCRQSDQSAALFEFVQWYQAELGDAEKLSKAIA